MTTRELIEAATEKFGSEAKLGNYLGYSQSYINNLKNEKIALRPVMKDALEHIVNGGNTKTTTVYVLSTDETVAQIQRLGDSYTALAKTLYECTQKTIGLNAVALAFSSVAIGLLLWEAAKHFWG
jgi:DNA invertase Pin-like site-specific DNA recombinase